MGKINYKKLLANYIYHVSQIEGTDFLSTRGGFKFEEDDLKELEYLSSKSFVGYPPYPYFTNTKPPQP